MSIGLSSVYYDLLTKTIKADQSTGVHVSDLRKIFAFHIKTSKITVTSSSSMFTHLTEMYLVAKGIDYNLWRFRGEPVISGIGYKSYSARLLVDTLNLGIEGSTSTHWEAKRHYDIVIAESSIIIPENPIITSPKTSTPPKV